jgi:hypothetical protein
MEPSSFYQSMMAIKLLSVNDEVDLLLAESDIRAFCAPLDLEYGNNSIELYPSKRTTCLSILFS